MTQSPSLAVQTPADNAAHVLIVEDDRRIRALLSRLLRENGYRATMAAGAVEARACMKSLAFDIIVLDVMMPGEDGFQLARSIRDGSAVPILMLTALAEPADRVRGLETGADDYLPKPFEPRELLLRIASILRRASPPATPNRSPTVRFGSFTFHIERGELREGEEIVRLTDRERDMLRLLADSGGEIVTRDALAGPTTLGNERTVDVQVNRLRRKIERDPANPAHLQTVRGAGYRLLLDR
jgi:two-component system phosphate regulon response regulator OmpR